MHKLPDKSSRVICSPGGARHPWEIKVTPPNLDFGGIRMFQFSAVQQISVVNTGNVPVSLTKPEVTGDFRVSSDIPNVLYPSEVALINVTFVPRKRGTATGAVYLGVEGDGSFELVRLVGFGRLSDNEEDNPGDGDDGYGVSPKFWSFVGDGDNTDWPLEGSDVSDKLFYDAAIETTPGSKVYTVLKPDQFILLPAVDDSPIMLRMNPALADGREIFLTLRGYARPWAGPAPEPVAPEIITTIIDNNTVIDRRYRNSLIVINSPTPFTILARRNTGDEELDWQDGEFFSVYQQGPGRVTIAPEGNGVVIPPAKFTNGTRDQYCTISATVVDPDAGVWASSGDLLRQSASGEKSLITLVDRTVLLGFPHTVGPIKDQFVMPHGFLIDAVADGGLFATLLTAQTDGTIFTVDLLRNGTSILQNKVTISNNQKTSKTASTPVVFVENGNVLTAGDEIVLSVSQVGNGTATGVRLYLTGERI